jgi:hypothetical protein
MLESALLASAFGPSNPAKGFTPQLMLQFDMQTYKHIHAVQETSFVLCSLPAI